MMMQERPSAAQIAKEAAELAAERAESRRHKALQYALRVHEGREPGRRSMTSIQEILDDAADIEYFLKGGEAP